LVIIRFFTKGAAEVVVLEDAVGVAGLVFVGIGPDSDPPPELQPPNRTRLLIANAATKISLIYFPPKK